MLSTCLLIGGVLSAAILFWFDPSHYHFYPTCLFYRTTGLMCPGCGSLRALHQLLHGNLAAAFRFNPLLVLALPALAWLGLRMLIGSWTGQPSGASLSRTWVLIFLGVTLVFSIWRNLPGSVFAALLH